VRILVADDDPVNGGLLQASLINWNCEVILPSDGGEAWDILQREDAPLAFLDWMMPGMEICREVRKRTDKFYSYIILLTSNIRKEDIIVGLEAGADDYLTKPFEKNELGLGEKCAVRDLWTKKDLGVVNDAFAPRIEPHGAGPYRILPWVGPVMSGRYSSIDAFQAWRSSIGRRYRWSSVRITPVLWWVHPRTHSRFSRSRSIAVSL